MALETEVWRRDIEDKLFEGNPHIMRSVDLSEWAENKTVHLPQAGDLSDIVKNPGTLPMTIEERSDSDLTFTLNEYVTKPILIRNIEEVQNSYPKRESVMRQHRRKLNERMGSEIIHDWAPGATDARQVRTTGSSVNYTIGGGSQSRLRLTPADLQEASKLLDEDLVPEDGRVLIIPPRMYYDLFADDDFKDAAFIGRSGVTADGVVAQAYGFDIIKRTQLPIYDNSGTPAKRAFGSDEQSTDNLAAIFYHEDTVCRAMDEIMVTAREGGQNPEYAGSGIVGAQIIFGGRALRTDRQGVGAIIQAS